MTNQYRQGDVLVIPIDLADLPKSLTAIILSVGVIVTFVVMSGMDVTITRISSFPWFDIEFLDGPNLFEANTPTGGDMGAHVFLPAYLRDNSEQAVVRQFLTRSAASEEDTA